MQGACETEHGQHDAAFLMPCSEVPPEEVLTDIMMHWYRLSFFTKPIMLATLARPLGLYMHHLQDRHLDRFIPVMDSW